MKAPIPIIFFFSLFYFQAQAQTTTAQNNANFGVDGELSANKLGTLTSPTDDWFSNGDAGPGTFIIDTTGAAAMVARYAVDPEYRKLPFYRTMRFPSYYVLNNRLLIDGVMIRDYHAIDSTAFSGSNKNAMSPADWQTPVSTPMQEKTDIEDMYVHLRRGGPDPTYDLWLMGGVSIVGINGERYFDFEMYQTDIFYERASRRFYNYGPDEGHTSWVLDAGGNIVKPGDVIFTAEYGNAGLSKLEARIWVNKSMLNIVPAGFDWVVDKGKILFTSANVSSQYGYAAIQPKTKDPFYTGLQSATNTWAGPFKFLNAANVVQDNFNPGGFMEFSVNLTKLGLDPVTMMGGSACGLPFRRLLAKTRTSNSFSSELQDFIGPFDFFMSPKVEAVAEVPILCTENGVSKINILNPYETSIYTWSTLDGNINGKTDTTSIYVDKPGTYIVKQELMDGCGAYATDTVNIVYDPYCTILAAKDIRLSGALKDGKPSLNWTSAINDKAMHYEVQRSTDGNSFETIDTLENLRQDAVYRIYSYLDETLPVHALKVSYRIKVIMHSSEFVSAPVQIQIPYPAKLSVYPNPAYKEVHISVLSETQYEAQISVINIAGKLVHQQAFYVKPGKNVLTINKIDTWPPGMYIVRLSSASGSQWQKLVVRNSSLL